MVIPVSSSKAVKRVTILCSCHGGRFLERKTPSMSSGRKSGLPAASLPVANSPLMTLVVSAHWLSFWAALRLTLFSGPVFFNGLSGVAWGTGLASGAGAATAVG